MVVSMGKTNAKISVNEKTKMVSIKGELSREEKEVVAAYVKAGYKVKPRRKSSVVKITFPDIKAYYNVPEVIDLEQYIRYKNGEEQDKEPDEKTKETFDKIKEGFLDFAKDMKARKINKNGIEQDQGFLVAVAELQKRDYNTYSEIMKKKETAEQTKKRLDKYEIKARKEKEDKEQIEAKEKEIEKIIEAKEKQIAEIKK